MGGSVECRYRLPYFNAVVSARAQSARQLLRGQPRPIGASTACLRFLLFPLFHCPERNFNESERQASWIHCLILFPTTMHGWSAEDYPWKLVSDLSTSIGLFKATPPRSAEIILVARTHKDTDIDIAIASCKARDEIYSFETTHVWPSEDYPWQLVPDPVTGVGLCKATSARDAKIQGCFNHFSSLPIPSSSWWRRCMKIWIKLSI